MRTTLSIAAALAVLGCIWLLWRDRVPEIRSVTLADGSIVRLKQVSFGSTHFPPEASVWQRMLWRLPTNITSSLGIRPRIQTTTNDTLVVRLEWLKGTNPRQHQPWIAVADPHGLQSACVRALNPSRLLNTSNLFTFELTNLPRRERALRIEVYGLELSPRQWQWLPLEHFATFRLRNPSFSRREPPMRRFPETTNVLGQSFAVASLHTGLTATGALAHVAAQQWTEILFTIGTNPPAVRAPDSPVQGDWSIHSVELRDRFGNYVFEASPLGRVFPSAEPTIVQNRDEGVVLARGSIWPDEIWNVRAEFVRNITPTLRPAESWTVTVPVPAAGEFFEIHQFRWIEGSQINVHSIESDGASPPLLHVEYRTPVRLSNAGILHAEDDLGRTVAASYRYPGNRDWFNLHTASNAKSVKVTFAASHGAIVYLSATAKIQRTNAAHWLHKLE